MQIWHCKVHSALEDASNTSYWHVCLDEGYRLACCRNVELLVLSKMLQVRTRPLMHVVDMLALCKNVLCNVTHRNALMWMRFASAACSILHSNIVDDAHLTSNPGAHLSISVAIRDQEQRWRLCADRQVWHGICVRRAEAGVVALQRRYVSDVHELCKDCMLCCQAGTQGCLSILFSQQDDVHDVQAITMTFWCEGQAAQMQQDSKRIQQRAGFWPFRTEG